jgi:hypothetical protein
MLPPGAGPSDPFILLASEIRALRQDVARYIQRSSGGDNPFGYSPRPASVYEHGVGHSGPSTVVGPGDEKQILNVGLKEIVPQGYYGMATVHVSVRTEAFLEIGREDQPNAALFGHVKWQNGDAGGDEDVDLTRGAIIPVGSTTSLVIDQVRLIPNVQGEDLVADRTFRVEAGISWETSADKDPPMTLPAVVLEANVASPFYEIPLQARSMLALGAPAAAYSTLIARFTMTQTVGARIIYEIPDPFRNGAPIRNGVQFVQFINTAPMTLVFPTFELW